MSELVDFIERVRAKNWERIIYTKYSFILSKHKTRDIMLNFRGTLTINWQGPKSWRCLSGFC